MLEGLFGIFGVGAEVLLGSREQFEQRLVLDDPFVLEVQPYLKRLSGEQRAYILKVLAAAPTRNPHKGGRPRSESTGNPTSRR